jgi:hypothetical protein
MSKLWFYAQQGTSEKKGPVPDDTIRSMVISGDLKAGDLVWSEGMSNWAPLSSVTELQPRAPALVASPATAAAAVSAPFATASVAAGESVPAGLAGWSTFVGVMTIMGGVLYCLSCIGAIAGIPMIIGGVALMKAKNMLPMLPSGDPALVGFLGKLKTFMLTMGLMYIISLIISILAIVLNVAAVAAALSGKMPQSP